MFKPTHTFFFGSKNCSESNKKGVPVSNSGHGADGLVMWCSDSEGNVAGWAQVDGTPNGFGSYVKPIK